MYMLGVNEGETTVISKCNLRLKIDRVAPVDTTNHLCIGVVKMKVKEGEEKRVRSETKSVQDWDRNQRLLCKSKWY